VDRSETAIQWTRENLEQNGFAGEAHTLFRAHTDEFLEKALKKGQTFDLAVVDPPSFWTRRASGDHVDISRDHPELLREVLSVMRPGGIVFFSTNHQGFVPAFDGLPAATIDEITARTIPEDYAKADKTIHRCWRLTLPA
jgi:23S rRNA G2069 N7-methylase RlmK/C1962 C5-methylase RlmI